MLNSNTQPTSRIIFPQTPKKSGIEKEGWESLLRLSETGLLYIREEKSEKQPATDMLYVVVSVCLLVSRVAAFPTGDKKRSGAGPSIADTTCKVFLYVIH